MNLVKFVCVFVCVFCFLFQFLIFLILSLSGGYAWKVELVMWGVLRGSFNGLWIRVLIKLLFWMNFYIL